MSRIECKSIIAKLNISKKKLSKGHRAIAEYIENNYDKAAFMTAAKLGRVVEISESTVVRFAAALGYDGYPEMQRALQEIVRHCLTASQRFAMSKDLSQEEAAKAVLTTDIRNIERTLSSLNNEVFSKVVEAVSAADTIYVLGLRSAAPLGQFLGYYLQYIFDDVRVVNAMSNNIFETVSRIKPTGALIAISFPRYSRRTLESMHFARQLGATVVGITDGPLSPLHECADLCLDAATDMESFVDSMAAPMSLINALLVALGRRNREKMQGNISKMEEIWEKYRVYTRNE